MSRARHDARTLARALAVAAAVAAGACAAGGIATPADEQAARDRADAAALARHLEVVPGVVRASAWLRRPVIDPLRPAPAAPPATAAALVIVIRGGTDAAATEEQVRAAAAAALAADGAPAPRIEVRLVAAPPPPPQLVRAGPFTVEAGSRVPLLATLALALVAIAGLAGWIVVIELRGRRSDESA